MKLSRFFSIAFNNPAFDIEYSKILETANAKGNIVISIDPIDYITMSINKSGWHSCHTLHNENDGRVSFGCYSAGTLSYMCDECTLISYRHSGKVVDYDINGMKFKGYSKNWREVIYYDYKTNAFVASRQYPFYDENISKAVRELFEKTISDYYGIENKWISRSAESSDYIRDYMEDRSDLHYNDVLHNYKHKLLYPAEVNKEQVKFRVGSYPVCPYCGEYALDYENRPMCDSCMDGIDDDDDDDDGTPF